jgi:hypothetical protein
VTPPTGAVEDPWARPGADFGFLTGVRDLGSGRLEISFDRATMLTGAAAEKYLEQHPEEDAYDYVIVNEQRRLRTYVVEASARFRGALELAAPEQGSPQGQDLTAAEFLVHARAALAGDGTVPVWLFHATTDLSSPVTALHEQYLP